MSGWSRRWWPVVLLVSVLVFSVGVAVDLPLLVWGAIGTQVALLVVIGVAQARERE